MKNFLKRRADLSNPENLIYIAAIGVFLPFQLTAAIIAVLGIYVLLCKRYRTLAFSSTGAFLVPLFTVFTVCVSLAHKNYLGALAALVFFLVLVLERFFRSIMTKELFERMLNICCLASLFAAFAAIIEKLIHFTDIWYRCKGDLFGNQYLSFYGHPNYLGAIMACAVLICAYKVIIIKERKKYYYLIAILDIITILLTESMFAWIEIFLGLSLLLLLARRHQLLGMLFIVTAFAALILYTNPQIFPRTAHIDSTFNSRVQIWDAAIKVIKENLWVGKGMFSFKATMPEHIHTHNLLFEFMLDFGIIGSLMLFVLLFIVCQKLVLCKNFLRKSGVTSLILSVACAVLIHSITDITIFWLQTGLFYALILSGLGAEEQVLNKIFKNKNQKQTIKIEEDSQNV